MARLLFYKGGALPPEAPLFITRLRQTRTRIGRVDDCDVVLPNEAVSRSHCLIDQLDGQYMMMDRSSNGTLLNGVRVARSRLQDGDRLGIGPFVAVCDLKDSAGASPTEAAQPERRDEELVAADSELAVQEAFLTVTRGPAEGERVRLRGGKLSVGSHGSKVPLRDPALLKDHVRIRLLHGRTLVEPGTGAAFVGGVRVRDVFPLYAGEEVRIGNTEFVVHWDERIEQPVADHFGDMVGSTEAMRRVFGILRRIAAHHAPVLLLGESGTGKELAARAIHEASPRASKPFVALNCGAIAQNLFESELFGHEKGAFTGAAERRDGAFHRADGGTIFLDEMGELPEDAQAKLLRVLETGEVRRVGGADTSFPDVRVVAATNRDLNADSQRGKFRSDLYFRLAVLAVRLPSLRERRDDIPVIAHAIARHIQSGMRIEPDAMEALCAHDWPGNARELRNVLTRAFVLSGPIVQLDSLMFNPLDTPRSGGPRPRVVAEGPLASLVDAERTLIESALLRNAQNRSAAAKDLGIPRSSLLYKLKRFGIG